MREIRRLPSVIRRLFDEKNPNIPRFSYFNPSSAFPYIYVRATEKIETPLSADVNHMLVYSYETDRMSMISIPKGLLKPTCNYYQGIEDTRLVMFNGRLWFVSTSTHVARSMRSEMIIGYFDAGARAIEHANHVDFGTRPIKNICPFVCDGCLYTIDMYTLTIYSIVEEKHEDGSTTCAARRLKALRPCSGVKEHTLRGSTNPVHLHGNLWGCVAHTHIPRVPSGACGYISYWVEFDMARGAVTFCSTPFIVSCLGIEFISGIEYYPATGNGIVELYFGVEDKDPMVAATTLHDLRVGM